jgi:hypothetical protein
VLDDPRRRALAVAVTGVADALGLTVVTDGSLELAEVVPTAT